MEGTQKTQEEIKAERDFPGAAIDAADNDSPTSQNVADDTKELNDIPYVN